MGKSPGKWMKTILFGKKTSKSNLSKGRETLQSSDKAALVSSNEPASDLAVDSPLISQPVLCTGARVGEDPALENGAAPKLSGDEVILPSAMQSGDAQRSTNLGSLSDSERVRLEQAATTAQAAFRGYLARRAFRALKGIIRLQALIRGHFVRRQAVATLYCVNRIVKLQALVRGQKDPKCLDYQRTRTSTLVEKLSDNAFVCKLLSSSPATMPLHLQYGPGEPNSAWGWLNRWTMSRIWESPSHPKKIIDSKSQIKQESPRTVEVAQVRRKRSVQKLHSKSVENGSSNSTLENEKLKRNPKKVSNIPVNSAPDQSQNGIDKVKRNLKKSSNPTAEVKKVTEMAVPKPSDVETSPKPPGGDGPVDEIHEHNTIELRPNQGSNEDIPLGDDKLSSKDDTTQNELQKTGRRRASLPVDQDCEENGLQNTPRVPSYMAATKSAKAKFRGQNSPRISQDGTEKISLTRRYSLPSSTNGNLPLSPRVEKLVLATGKGVIRSDKTLLSSRDGNEKVIQAEWRR